VVTGPGSLLSVTNYGDSGGSLNVGNFGSGNSMVISDGGVVESRSGAIGYDAAASNNSVLVTGANSVWTNSGGLTVGDLGSGNSLVISNGGTVTCVFGGYIGNDTASSNNSALVTGTNSLWTISGTLNVGYDGSGNALIISNRGEVENAFGTIGETATASNNSVLVTGAGSLWTNAGDLNVGYQGSGNSLVISNGGTVVNADGYLGGSSISSNNSVLVTGAGSLWTNGDELAVGYDGSSNSLVIDGGAQVADSTGYIGAGMSSSNNSVVVSDAGTLWTNSLHVYVGNAGSGSSLTISNGAQVANVDGGIGYQSPSSNNIVVVSDAGTLWTNAGDVYVGNDGSGNSLTISNGAQVADSYGYIGNGAPSSNNSVLVTGANSLWTNSANLYVGNYGSGSTLTVADGGTVAATGISIADQSGSSGTLNIGRFGTNDAAGTIAAGTITFGAGTGAINFNQSDAFTLSADISGNGSVNLLGSGTTALTGSNTYSGGTTMAGGVLRVANAGALGAGALVASNGTTLQVTNGIAITNDLSVYTVKFLDGGNTLSGRITNNNSVYDVAPGTTNTVSGYITGPGGLELTGGGVLDVTGTTNDYAGATSITNGTLRIATLANAGTASSIGTNGTVNLAGANATNAVLDYTGGNVATDRNFVTSGGGGTINMATSSTEMTLTGSASGSGKLIVGEGTMVLSNTSTPNAFAPASIQVDSGATLQLAASDQIGNTTGLILNGGTFLVGTATAGFSETLGTLTLTANSTIDLGAWSTGVRQLTFADSSAIAWTGTLTITNWQGVAFQSSDVAEVLFGVGGLTSTQLGQVYWANQGINGGALLGSGELVPIPEPRVYAAVVCLLFAIGWRERKRVLRLFQRSAGTNA